eukprot:421686_1
MSRSDPTHQKDSNKKISVLIILWTMSRSDPRQQNNVNNSNKDNKFVVLNDTSDVSPRTNDVATGDAIYSPSVVFAQTLTPLILNQSQHDHKLHDTTSSFPRTVVEVNVKEKQTEIRASAEQTTTILTNTITTNNIPQKQPDSGDSGKKDDNSEYTQIFSASVLFAIIIATSICWLSSICVVIFNMCKRLMCVLDINKYIAYCLIGSIVMELGISDTILYDTHNASGIIDLGYGVFNMNLSMNLSENTHVVIRGKGQLNTTLNYISNPNHAAWFECHGIDCYLKLMDIKLTSDKTLFIPQFLATNNATLEFENVLFDGNEYAQSNIDAIWQFGSGITSTFKDCVFENNDVKYIFAGANITFINCIFTHNIATSADAPDEQGMFVMQSFSHLLFVECIFQDATNLTRPLITVYSGSLLINTNQFLNISGYDKTNTRYENALLLAIPHSQSEINIIDSFFDHIANYAAIFMINGSSIELPIKLCALIIQDSVFKHGVNRADYSGDYCADLTVTNCQFIHGNTSVSSLNLLATRNIIIQHTIWEHYTTSWDSGRPGIITKTTFNTPGVGYYNAINLINNITMKDIIGGGIFISSNSYHQIIQPITIINSHFYNLTGHTWITLHPTATYFIRNNRFINCDCSFSALSVYEAGTGSVFESLTFMNNYASANSPADCVIYKERVGGTITINGTWYISGSESNSVLASSLRFVNGYSTPLWTITMNNWVIRDTFGYTGIAVIRLEDVNLEVVNLTAVNNKGGVFNIAVFRKPYENTTHSIINSYFGENGNTIIQNWDRYFGWPTSTIQLSNNTFYNNKNGILEIKTFDGSISTQVSGKTLCVAKNQSILFTDAYELCENNDEFIQIRALRIANVTDGIAGVWWGCKNSKCYLKKFKTQSTSLNVDEIKISVNNEDNWRNSLIKWYKYDYQNTNDSSWAFFENFETENASIQYVFDNVNVSVSNCRFETGLIKHEQIVDHGLFQVNNGILNIEQTVFRNNERVLINTANSLLFVTDTNFTNNSGGDGLLSRQPMIVLHSTETVIFNTKFERNSHFSAIIDVNYSGIHIQNTTFINGYDNYCDYCSNEGVTLFLLDTVFQNGILYRNSLDISDNHHIHIGNTIWTNYVTTNVIRVIKHDSQNNESIAYIEFINNIVRNIKGRGVFIHGNYSNIDISGSEFSNIQTAGNGGCVSINTNCATAFYKGNMIQNRQNISVKSSTFFNCTATIGGAMYIHSHQLHIEGTEFTQNEASIGAATFFSLGSMVMITTPDKIVVSVNDTIKHLSLNITNVSFTTKLIYIALVPLDEISEQLNWLSQYQWTNKDIYLSNDLSQGSVYNLSYISPIFIPMTTVNNELWNISSDSTLNLVMDFQGFLSSMKNQIITLEVKIFATEWIERQNNTASLSIIDSVFRKNSANVLSTVLMNFYQLQSINVILTNIVFEENIASGVSSLGIFNYQNYSESSSKIQMESVNFISNTALTYTAGIATNIGSNSVFWCNKCTFVSNNAGYMASALYIKSNKGQIMLQSSTITKNYSPLGANVLIDNTELNAYNTSFIGNRADIYGTSVIQIDNIHQLINNEMNGIVFDSCLFMNNSGINFGCIYVPITDTHDPTFTVKRSLLSTEPWNVSVSNVPNNGCDEFEIMIQPDFHSEDIYWTVQFGNDSANLLNGHSLYSCITNIPSIAYEDCITFTIFDAFGDGLNYGQGTYTIKLNGKEYKSASWGNFGQHESLQICPMAYSEGRLQVLSILGDPQSYMFTDFLNSKLLPGLDDLLRLILIMRTYEKDDQRIDPSKCDCLSSVSLHCVCDTRFNTTMDNIISVICYTWDLEMQAKYNYTYADFWFHKVIFNDTVIQNECSGFGTINSYKKESLLNINNYYIDLANVDLDYLPNPTFLFNSSLYFDMVSPIMQKSQSYCDLYQMAYEIIDPICQKLIFNENEPVNPTLCQASMCHTSYCESNQTYLSVTTNNHDFNILQHNHYMGSILFNIQYTPSTIYGMDQYLNNTQFCFDEHNINKDSINNTIPILFGDIYNCDYTFVISKMQRFGARAVIIVTNITDIMNRNKSDNVSDIFIPVELVSHMDAMFLVNKSYIQTALLCETISPTSAPSTSPTVNPSKTPTETPTKIPTTDPTVFPTPNPVISAPSDDDFIIFTYNGIFTPQGYGTQFQQIISFPPLPFGQFLNMYQHCGLTLDNTINGNDDAYVFFITIDTIFAPFDNLCIQFNDNTNAMIIEWNTMKYENGLLYLTSITTDSDTDYGCLSKSISYRKSLPITYRGTSCFVMWTSSDKGKKKYNFIIKPLFGWMPAFITITNSTFIDNTNIEGKGGAITIESSIDINEHISVLINNTYFQQNYAGLGGAAIYRRFAQTKAKDIDTFPYMSTMEIHNVVIDNSNSRNTSTSIMIDSVTSESDGFIFGNAISIVNVTIVSVPTTRGNTSSHGGVIHLNGANVYIKDSSIMKGSALNGGCIYSNNSAFTLYNTVISECTAFNNGGALYRNKDLISSPYDLCLSIYNTQFINNDANGDGAAIFADLNGALATGNDLKSRESCFKIYNTQFNDNSAGNEDDDSIYLFIERGDHALLNGNNPLTHICDQCFIGSNTLRYICASVDESECYQFISDISILEYIPSVQNVRDQSVTLHVFGWNSFLYPLNTNKFSIEAQSNNSIIHYHQSEETGKYYNTFMSINDNEQNATVLLKDSNIANSIILQLTVYDPTPILFGSDGISIQTVVLSVLATVIFVIIIICCVVYKKYMEAHVIKNAMALIIVITKFDDPKLIDLPEDTKNAEKLIKLWRDTYKYDVRVCNYDIDKHGSNIGTHQFYSTKADVFRFLDKNLKELPNYDGIIVHIITHGCNGQEFQTSDGKTMQLKAIKHEINEATHFYGHEVCIKILFYHACRGDASYQLGASFRELDMTYNQNKCNCFQNLCCNSNVNNTKSEEIAIPHNNVEMTRVTDTQLQIVNTRAGNALNEAKYDNDNIQNVNKNVHERQIGSMVIKKSSKAISSDANCVTIFQNIDNRTTSSEGLFTKYICKIFNKNARRWKKKDFLELLIGEDGLCQNLDIHSEGAEICTTEGIGTLAFKSIRFEVCNRTSKENSTEDELHLLLSNDEWNFEEQQEIKEILVGIFGAEFQFLATFVVEYCIDDLGKY